MLREGKLCNFEILLFCFPQVKQNLHLKEKGSWLSRGNGKKWEHFWGPDSQFWDIELGVLHASSIHPDTCEPSYSLYLKCKGASESVCNFLKITQPVKIGERVWFQASHIQSPHNQHGLCNWIMSVHWYCYWLSYKPHDSWMLLFLWRVIFNLNQFRILESGFLQCFSF